MRIKYHFWRVFFPLSFFPFFFFSHSRPRTMTLSPSPVGIPISWKPHEFPPGQPALWGGCVCLCLCWAQCYCGRNFSRAGAETAGAENCSWSQLTSPGRGWLSHSPSLLLHPVWPKRIFLNKCISCAVQRAPAKSMFCCLEILENKEHLVGRTQYKQRHEN